MTKDLELLERLVGSADNMENVEMIEIASPDEVMEDDQNLPENLSLLPLRNTVLFPGIVIPVTVTRSKAIRLVKKAYRSDRTLGIISQLRQTKEEPETDDLYKIGTIGTILKMIVLPDGNVTIIVQGRRRFKIKQFLKQNPYLIASVDYINDVFPPMKRRKPRHWCRALKKQL